MFRLLEDLRPPVALSFEGQTIIARDGDSVAAALLAAGVRALRTTPVSGAPRAPWCMMGVCFDCLVEIDGVAGRQACMVPVAAGMRVVRQDGSRSVGPPSVVHRSTGA